MSYYDRTASVHLDGTKIFQSEDDRRNEREVASAVEKAWRCRVVSFGALSPVDWFAERDGRLVSILELKSRTHPHDKYPTVFLNVRKWLALSLGAVGLGCPALFVVRFADGVYWVRLSDVDAGRNKVGGCSRFVKNANDVEPVIDVPVSSLRALA